MVKYFNYVEPELQKIMHQWMADYGANYGISCKYKRFSIVEKANDGEIIGVLLGYTTFAEIHVDDICVKFGYRHKGLGARLLQEVEDRFISKGYNNINLVTSEFQATEFYKKCGFEVEFIRKNKQNPKLTKTFFIKYIDDIKYNGN